MQKNRIGFTNIDRPYSEFKSDTKKTPSAEKAAGKPEKIEPIVGATEQQSSIEEQRKESLGSLYETANKLSLIVDGLPFDKQSKTQLEALLNSYHGQLDRAGQKENGGYESNLVSVEELSYVLDKIQHERKLIKSTQDAAELYKHYKDNKDLNIENPLRQVFLNELGRNSELYESVQQETQQWVDSELSKSGADKDKVRQQADDKKLELLQSRLNRIEKNKDQIVLNGLELSELRKQIKGSENITTQAEYLGGKSFGELPKDQQQAITQEAKAQLENDPALRQMAMDQYFKDKTEKGLLKPEEAVNISLTAVAEHFAKNRKFKKLPAEEGLVFVGKDNQKLVHNREINPQVAIEKWDKIHGTETALEKIGETALEKVGDQSLKKNPEKRKAYLVDISELAKRMAETKAEEILKKDLDGSGYLKRVWRGLSENYYRIKYYQEALNEIKSNNNLMKAIEGRILGQQSPEGHVYSNSDYYRILDSVVERFDAELADKTKEEGELLSGNKQVSSQLADMFRRHANGKWDDLGDQYKTLADKAKRDPSAQRELIELYTKEHIAGQLGDADWGKGKDSKKKEGLLYASNFFEMAENYKNEKHQKIQEAIEKNPEQAEAIMQHYAGLENLDVQLGYRKADLANANGRAALNVFEKMQDFAEGNKYLSKIFANPVTYGIAAAAGSRLALTGGKWGTLGAVTAIGLSGGSVLIPLGIGAGVVGAYSYIKRSKNVKYDVSQELRNETLGGKGSEVLDKSDARVVQKSYAEAISFLEGLKSQNGTTNKGTELQDLAEIVAMRERELSSGNKRDLFTLTEEEGKKFGTTEVAQTQLDKLLKDFQSSKGFQNGEFRKLVDQKRSIIDSFIVDADKCINKFKNKEARKAAVIGGVASIAGGLIAQQAVYSADRFLGTDFLKSRNTTLEAFADYWKEWNNPGSTKIATGNMIHTEGATNIISGTEAKPGTPGTAGIEYPWSNMTKLIGEYHDRIGRHGIRNLLFEGKQQQGDLILDKQTNKVSASIDRMMNSLEKNIKGIGKPGINWDKSVDKQLSHVIEEMRSHSKAGDLHNQMEIRVFPKTPGEGYVAGSVNEQNQLGFSDIERNTLFDAEGKQLAREIQYGYRDNEGKYHVFATSVGKGIEVPVGSPGIPGTPDIPGQPPVIEQGPGSSTPEMIDPLYDPAVPVTPIGRKVWKRDGQEYPKRQLGDGSAESSSKKKSFAERFWPPIDRKIESAGSFVAAKRQERLDSKNQKEAAKQQTIAEQNEKYSSVFGKETKETRVEDAADKNELKISQKQLDAFVDMFRGNDRDAEKLEFFKDLTIPQQENLKHNINQFNIQEDAHKIVSKMKSDFREEIYNKMLRVMLGVDAERVGEKKISWSNINKSKDNGEICEVPWWYSTSSAKNQIESFLRKSRKYTKDLKDTVETEGVEKEEVVDRTKPEWVTDTQKWEQVMGKGRRLDSMINKENRLGIFDENEADFIREKFRSGAKADLIQVYKMLGNKLADSKDAVQRDKIQIFIKRTKQFDDRAKEAMREAMLNINTDDKEWDVDVYKRFKDLAKTRDDKPVVDPQAYRPQQGPDRAAQRKKNQAQQRQNQKNR